MKSESNHRLNKAHIILPMLLILLVMIANTVIVPVLKESVKDRIDEKAVGWFLSLSFLGSVLFSPLSGWLSDRSGRRKAWIIVTAFISSACYFYLSVFPSPVPFFLTRFVEGASAAFTLSLLLAMMGDFEAELHKPYLMGLAGMMLALGGGLGFPLGALGKSNPQLPFLAAAITMCIVGFMSFFLKDATRLSKTVQVKTGEFFTLMKSQWLLIIPLLFIFIDRLTGGFASSSLNLHLRETVGLDAAQTGRLLGYVFLPMGLLAYPVTLFMNRYGILLSVLLGSGIYGVALLFLGLTQSSAMLSLILVVAGVGAALMFVPTLALTSRLAPASLRATAIGSYMGVGSLGFLIGPLLSVYVKSWLNQYFDAIDSFAILAGFFGSLELLMVIAVLPFSTKIITLIRQKQEKEKQEFNKQL
ncbi:MAG: MFS transporter [Leptonema sp. (in: Bacteria)]|nr:MFS transporter [Leptonema sp. (in: bacteria)]